MEAAQRASNGQIADHRPSGSDLLDGEGLEFTDAYLTLEALMVNHDADVGAPLKKGEEPFRWSHVEAEIRHLLERAMDLRVAIWHLRALMTLRGPQGLADGLARIADGLRQPAPAIFPRAEPGENPREVHAVALDWLGSPAFLAQIRQLRLSGRSTLTLGDVEAPRSGAETPTAPMRDEALPAVKTAQQHLQTIRQAIYDQGAHWLRDPVHALECLANLARALGTEGPAPAALPAAEGAQQPHAPALPDSPHNRAQVKRLLEHVQTYYERSEPSHPAPILIGRLLRMVDASFPEILSELYAEHEQLTARLEKPSAS